MGIHDRDWYRDSLRGRQGVEAASRLSAPRRPASRHAIAPPREHSSPSAVTAWALATLLAIAAVSAAYVDLKRRNVPMTCHGLTWWASIAIGKPAIALQRTFCPLSPAS